MCVRLPRGTHRHHHRRRVGMEHVQSTGHQRGDRKVPSAHERGLERAVHGERRKGRPQGAQRPQGLRPGYSSPLSAHRLDVPLKAGAIPRLQVGAVVIRGHAVLGCEGRVS